MKRERENLIAIPSGQVITYNLEYPLADGIADQDT